VLKRSTKRIHFVGAGGAGVSALAHLMLQMGYEVTGSDTFLSPVTAELAALGATVWQGHDERYVRSADLVVYSTAIKEDNPEIAYAMQHPEKGLVSRIEFLSYLTEQHDSIIVSGSHGKSTTSSMLATAMLHAQQDPTVVLGSVVKSGNIGSARLGKSKLFVLEGDESNNSILRFQPKVAVVTNIDCDHMDFHGDLANLKSSFLSFLNSPPRSGLSVVCMDDDNIRSILGQIKGAVVTYGFHPDAEYRAERSQVNREGGKSFEVHHKESGPLGRINLRMPGDYNVQNALATVTVCHKLGVRFDHVSFALENFPGVCRRYDVLSRGDVIIIDDYAHHPSEISALLSSVREVYQPPYRIRAVFQPHRYTRSKNLAEQFPGSFHLADEILLAPIYDAQEKPIAGIGIGYLNEHFKRRYDERKLKCIDNLADIEEYIFNSSQPGDVVLTVGAGDVCKVGYGLARRYEEQSRQRMVGVDIERIASEMLTEQSLFESER
jgi:UDP-N-acetylmuramate--alanine ligase